MSTLTAISAALPSWFLPLGWAFLLLGWALGRPKVQTIIGKVTAIGVNVHVTNTVHPSDAGKLPTGDSPLSKLGSWASLVGLVLALLPMVQSWLKPAC
jgi:hypothetical protein